MVVEVIYGPGPGPHRESGRTIWCRHCPVEAYPVVAFIGSSELSVGGSVDAFCDEEHSELVVGGVRCWLRLCRSRPRIRPSTCVGFGPGGRFRGWDTLVGAR